MNSVWHSNFSVGPSSSTKDDFLWNPLCLGPLCTRCHSTSAEEAEEFFGHPVQKAHLSSVDFVSRGRFLPLAKANARDLTRAAQRKPGRSFQGRTFQETMQKLNKLLTLEADLKTKACDQFSMSELHDVQQLLFDARSPKLNRIYKDAGDTRTISHDSIAEVRAEQAWRSQLPADLAKKAQDG